MSGPEATRPSFLAVKNREYGETLIMAFHGEEYVWDPGETVNISFDAAKHIFGFGLEDKVNAFHRLGWVNTRPGGSVKDAEHKLKQFDFVPVKQTFAVVPSQPSSNRAIKTRASNSDRSLAGAGDSAAESSSDSAAATGE